MRFKTQFEALFVGRLTKQNNKQGPRPKSEEEGSGAGSCGRGGFLRGPGARRGSACARPPGAAMCPIKGKAGAEGGLRANPAFFECWRAGCVGQECAGGAAPGGRYASRGAA